jgi:hypothetical protein
MSQNPSFSFRYMAVEGKVNTEVGHSGYLPKEAV